MKTAIILLMSVVLFMTVPASAQFTLTQASFPATGSHNIGEAASPATFDVGPSGASRTWTFGDYAWSYVTHEELVTAATSPYYAHFTTSNRCVLMTGDFTSVYGYFRMAANGLYFLGTGSVDTVMTPVSEARVIPFPCTYQTNWTTVIRFDWEPVPGYHFTVTDSSLNTVDGWGTLVTPYGSNAALRLFDHTWNITQVPLLPPTITQNVGYSWFSSQGEQLLVLVSEDDVTDPNFGSGYLEMTGVPQVAEPVRGPIADKFVVGQNYPNPFNPATTLPVALERNARVTMKIYDETGRLVSQEEFNLPAGEHQLPINGSNWSTGTYFANVSAGADQQTVKMQLVK